MKKHLTTLAAALAVGAVLASPAPVAQAEGDSYLTILATTDTHGHVYNWDYFADAAYPQGKIPELGMARVDTIVDNVRAAKGADSVLVLDNGDAIQGTPLTYLAAMQADKLPHSENPMAVAFNEIGYEAQVLGNHEFNYGLPYLDSYINQLNAPMLGANIVKAGTDEPAYTPYVMIDKVVDGKTVKVGVLGVDTPGVRIWDKANVSGKLDFKDCVETAQKYVPQMKAEGADVVVVLIHSGLDAEGVAWNPELLQENVAKSLSTLVNDVDVVIGGHSHVTNKASVVYTAPDGDRVLFTQPYYWAQSVSQVQVPIALGDDGKPHVAWPGTSEEIGALATALETKDVADSPDITNNQILKDDHAATVKYVNTVVAQSTEELPGARATAEDTPILDYIAMVQSDTVATALKGTEYESLPVISQVSPFSRTAVFPKGDVTIKDIAGLYIYENTLLGVKMTGAEIKDYLEWSARFYKQTEEGATYDVENGGNALYEGETRGIPDYSVDMIQGLDYLVDISKPVGERILGLSHPDGTPVADTDEFVLAVNNYRQSGGSAYPHVAEAPVVYDEVLEIRQLIIERAESDGIIDPKDFFEDNWALVTKTPAPTATAAAESYKPGDTMEVRLAGFVPNKAVKVDANGSAITVMADANGEATVTLAPADTAGTAMLSAYQLGQKAETTIEISSADTPAAEPTTDPTAPAAADAKANDKATATGAAVAPATNAPAAATTPLAKTGTAAGALVTAMMAMLTAGGLLLRRKVA